MSEAHGERRHQPRQRGETEESRQRRSKETPGEQTREHTKQVTTHIIIGLGPFYVPEYSYYLRLSPVN